MNLDTTPVVSVVTATRNRPGLLRETLASVAAQTFDRFEAIILDDGSSAETLRAYDDIIASLDARFRLVRPAAPDTPGTGPSAARNRGLRLARGEFVAFLDDDDRWTSPDHLAVGVEALQRQEADYYFTNMRGVRHGEVVIADWFPDSPKLTAGQRVSEKPPVYEVGLAPLMAVMRHHLVHGNQAIARRDLLNAIGGYWERVRFAEDYELMMRIIDRARRVLYRPEIVVDYRLPSGDSISAADSRLEQELQFLMISQHVRAVCHRPLVRWAARAREGWTLRQVAWRLQELGRDTAALSFAWQAPWVFPTAGSVLALLKALGLAAASGLGLRKPPASHP